MSKLNELIKELCPAGVEYKKLEECCNILDKKRKPITKSLREAGKYPYYGANGVQDYVANYIFDGTFVLVGEDGSVITSKGRPIVNWAKGKIWVNNHAHIVEEKEGVLLRFLYYFIQTVDITTYIHGNIPKFTGGDFKSILIPVPPLPVQEEIVRILDTFSQLQAELQAKLQSELQARKKQYEYYIQKLICYGTIYKIGDIATIKTGQKPKNIIGYVTQYEYINAGTSNSGYTNSYNCDGDTTTTPSRGQGGIGYVGFQHYNFWLGPLCYSIKSKNISIVLNRYIYFYLKCFSDKILQYKKEGGTPSVNGSDLINIKIHVPELKRQKYIISILDRFDTLCNDLTQSIPAEIEARQKQYEYYRDKLLTFKTK